MTGRGAATGSRDGFRHKPAFSLVEVLVVFAIVLFLLALLVPGLNSAKERARRLVCANNLRQWGVALQYYRDEHNDYLPTEGAYLNDGILKPGTWFNELPPYLGLPPYKDFERANEVIRELPNIHVWICPSKNLTAAYKSDTGMNQFHYGMNQVLDGLGTEDRPSPDTPGLLDQSDPLPAKIFQRHANTVFLFDIYPNSMAGTPRSVATMHQRHFISGGYVGKFHGDYANVLYLSGAVGNCTTDDLVTDRDFKHGEVVWNNRKLYWGYPPP